MTCDQRHRVLEEIDNAKVDVLIVGGGINGAVSAAALSAAGISAALVEKGDFSSATTQESSNMIWGGFKYLQSFEFGLVRKLCQSRNRLIDAYPSQVQPIEFMATFDDESPYPMWLAGLGAAAYWAIGNFSTKSPRLLRPRTIEKLEPVINTEKARGALIYADAYLPDNDARFSFGFIRDALDRGLLAVNYTRLVDAEFIDQRWNCTLVDSIDGTNRKISAKVIINTTGPWADELNAMLGVSTKHRIAFSKGIHLVVPRVGSGDRVFAFFDEDDRLYYVIPMGDRSVIGTTDTRVDDPETQVSTDDREFVLRQINSRLDLEVPLQAEDVIAERCGVRPLVVETASESEERDWLQLSRKHEIERDSARQVITVFGGKLTDCLNVGEEVTEALAGFAIVGEQLDSSWYGEPPSSHGDAFETRAMASGMHASVARLIWRRHSVQAHSVLDRIIQNPDLAEVVWDDPSYLAAEVVEIGENEMVTTLEDFLRRRTGLALTEHSEELEARAEIFKSLLGLSNAETR